MASTQRLLSLVNDEQFHKGLGYSQDTLERITAERTALYSQVPTPGGKHPGDGGAGGN